MTERFERGCDLLSESIFTWPFVSRASRTSSEVQLEEAEAPMQLTISSIPLTFASKWTRTRTCGRTAGERDARHEYPKVCKIHASSVRVSSRRVSRDTSIASCINNRNYPILEFSPIADMVRTRPEPISGRLSRRSPIFAVHRIGFPAPPPPGMARRNRLISAD